MDWLWQLSPLVPEWNRSTILVQLYAFYFFSFFTFGLVLLSYGPFVSKKLQKIAVAIPVMTAKTMKKGWGYRLGITTLRLLLFVSYIVSFLVAFSFI